MNTTELRKEMEKAYPAIFLKHGFEKVRTEFSSNINGNIIKGYKYEKNTSPNIRVSFTVRFSGHHLPHSIMIEMNCVVTNKAQVELTKDLFVHPLPHIDFLNNGTFDFDINSVIGLSRSTETYLTGEISLKENLKRFETVLMDIMMPVCKKYSDQKVLCQDLKTGKANVTAYKNVVLPVLCFMLEEYADAKKYLEIGRNRCKEWVKDAKKELRIVQRYQCMQEANEHNYNKAVEWLNAYTIFRSNLCKLIDEKVGEMTFMEKVRYIVTDILS